MNPTSESELSSIKLVLEEQRKKIADYEKQRDLKKPKGQTKIDKTHAKLYIDESTDSGKNAVDSLLNLAKVSPFMSFFSFCALQQNRRALSREECVFQFSVRNPRFYRLCRDLDLILLGVAVLAFIFSAFWSIFKILR